MEPRSYLSQPPRHSESRLLRDLYALNRQFISLLLLSAADGSRSGLLEPYLLARLSELPDPQLDRLATCPYSLFDVRFAESSLWSARRQEGNTWGDPPGGDGGTGHRPAFTLSALVFARQLADCFPDLARLLLGMNRDVATALSGFSLPALSDVAFRSTHWLEARLAGHRHFWPDLIDFVREGTQERYLAAQTLGMQQSALKL